MPSNAERNRSTGSLSRGLIPPFAIVPTGSFGITSTAVQRQIGRESILNVPHITSLDFVSFCMGCDADREVGITDVSKESIAVIKHSSLNTFTLEDGSTTFHRNMWNHQETMQRQNHEDSNPHSASSLHTPNFIQRLVYLEVLKTVTTSM
jgi:hypothetical protein